VYVSSSYAVRPVNWYGATKQAGELLASRAPLALIVRTQFKERPYPYEKAPTDAYARALYADQVAPILVEMVEQEVRGLRGVYGERRSLFDFARESRPDVRACLRRDLPHPVPADASPEAEA
jgi:dTDP-4-dehydrorhamnose reductase